MNPDKIYNGVVKRYEIEKYFGFIETAENESYFFYRDKAEAIKLQMEGVISSVRCFMEGDEVTFRLKPSASKPDKLEAYEVSFIRNKYLNKLVEEYEKGKPLTGYLTYNDRGWSIKLIDASIFLRVEISEWEINREEIYNSRLNKLVKFHLKTSRRAGIPTAFLHGRQFSEEYKKLIALQSSGESIRAFILSKNEYGFYVTVFENMPAFLQLNNIPEQKVALLNYQKGDSIMAKVNFISKNGKLVLGFSGDND